MELFKLISCILLVALIGQTYAELVLTTEPSTIVPTTAETITRYTTTAKPTTKPTRTTTRSQPTIYYSTTPKTTKPPTTTTTTPEPTRNPCGSNNLGDYKGGCDESVPVIVMPKGRPIMERVLEWFKCGTKSCL